MGDISSKHGIDSLQGLSLLQHQTPASSNIFVMNPEIHLHSNEVSAGSTNCDDVRIKKLQRELEIRQTEIDLERQMRAFEEHQRHADNVRNEQLIREKESQIQDQKEVLNRCVKILNEQTAHLEEVYMYGRREERFLMGNWSTDGIQRSNQNQWKRNHEHQSYNNRYLTKNYTNAKKKGYHHQRGHRSRTKTENYSKNDPLELWEFNGTKWVNITKNGAEPYREQVGEFVCNKTNSEQQNPNYVTQSQNNAHEGLNNGTLQSNVPLHRKVCGGVTSNSDQTKNIEVFYLDDTVERIVDASFTFSNDVAVPTNISISFDEREIRKHRNHDESLFSMPKRAKNLNDNSA